MMFKILENTWDKLSKKKQYGLLLALLVGVNIYYAPEKIRRTEILEFSAEKGDVIMGIASSRQSTSVGRGKTESSFFLHAMDFRINKKKWQCICYLTPCVRQLEKAYSKPREYPMYDFSQNAMAEKLTMIAINHNKCFVLEIEKNRELEVVGDIELGWFKAETYFKDPRRGMWRVFFNIVVIGMVISVASHQFRSYLKRKKS